MRKSFVLGSVGLLAAVALLLTSCDSGTAPADKISSNAKIIKVATASTIAVGLVAVPNQEEATNVAKLALDALNTSVLPILNGDEAGLAAGLQKIIKLEAFNDPKLAKIKAIFEVALPALLANVPADLLDKPLSKVPADVKAYVNAFFNGAADGLNSYIGSSRDPNVDWKAFRQKLAQ